MRGGERRRDATRGGMLQGARPYDGRELHRNLLEELP